VKHFDEINKQDKCIVQKYIDNPYLIERLKFDLRIYILLAGLSPMRIFIYKDGLARFATFKYEPAEKGNLGNLMMHLTNYSINKKSKDFIFNTSETNMGHGHKRNFQSVFDVINSFPLLKI